MTGSLHDRVLATLDPVLWRSCLDIAARVNSNTVDTGCVLKRLVAQKIAERRVGKADLSINFCYRLCEGRTPCEEPVAYPPPPMPQVTPAMRLRASEIVQSLLLKSRRMEVSNMLGLRSQYVSFIASNQARSGRCGYAAPAAAILHVLEYVARQEATPTISP